MEIGALIRKLRLERAVSQAALAREAGTSQPAIARLEGGRVSPSLDTIEKILQALGLRLELATIEIDSGVDMTLIAQSLRLTPSQRLAKLETEFAAIDELRKSFRSRSA